MSYFGTDPGDLTPTEMWQKVSPEPLPALETAMSPEEEADYSEWLDSLPSFGSSPAYDTHGPDEDQ